MYCTNCGVETSIKFMFCKSCGEKRSESENQVVPWLEPKQSANIISQKHEANFENKNAPRAMLFLETIEFSYKNYANFDGRASRSEFWYWALYNVVTVICLVFFGWLFSASFSALLGISTVLIYCFIISSIIPNLARIARRLHDTNKPLPYGLFALVPLVGNILLTVWFCTKGDTGPNKFGPGDLNNGKESQYEVRQEPTITPIAVASGEENNSLNAVFKDFVKDTKLVVATILMLLVIGTLQAYLMYWK